MTEDKHFRGTKVGDGMALQFSQFVGAAGSEVRFCLHLSSRYPPLPLQMKREIEWGESND